MIEKEAVQKLVTQIKKDKPELDTQRSFSVAVFFVFEGTTLSPETVMWSSANGLEMAVEDLLTKLKKDPTLSGEICYHTRNKHLVYKKENVIKKQS